MSGWKQGWAQLTADTPAVPMSLADKLRNVALDVLLVLTFLIPPAIAGALLALLVWLSRPEITIVAR